MSPAAVSRYFGHRSRPPLTRRGLFHIACLIISVRTAALFHNIRPDFRRQRSPADLFHRAVVVVADPNRCRVSVI